MPVLGCDLLASLLAGLPFIWQASLPGISALLSSFVPLNVHLSTSPPCFACRLARQESALWSRLHVGVLTTGCLADLLGLKEAEAAGFLRSAGAGMVGHSHLLDACARLRQAPDRMWQAHYPGCADGNSSSSSGITEHPSSCCQHVSLLAAVQQYHRGGTDAAVQQYHRDGKDVPVALQQDGPVAGNQTDVSGSSGKEVPKRRAGGRRKRCMAAAAGGLQGVRLAWGKTQEGAALMTLLRLMPCSTLHEVRSSTGWVGGGGPSRGY